MPRPLRIEDIEEFTIAGRIPRTGISAEILAGVRKLLEVDELEPALRKILSDPTETPHGSTEIADILTHHVTINGKAQLSAFINKGRATPKVTSAAIGHQILNLKQLQGLDVAVLLCVGDIHDNAKRDFVGVAEDAGADFLIVDAIDVARILIANQFMCPIDGRMFVDGVCPECATSADKPVQLFMDLNEDLHYEVLSIEDVSHAMARRYSADVLADPHYSKSTLREVVKTVVEELRSSQYSRSDLVKQHFGGQSADCVFLFIYLTFSDKQRTNWVCRAQWINPDLPEKWRPTPFKGNDRLGEIVIDWKQDLNMRRKLLPLSSKREWIEMADQVVQRTDGYAETVAQLLVQFDRGVITESQFALRMSELEVQCLTAADQAGAGRLPPTEVNDCDQALQDMLALLHNATIAFAGQSKIERTWDSKLWMVRHYLNAYTERRAQFDYELRKTR